MFFRFFFRIFTFSSKNAVRHQNRPIFQPVFGSFFSSVSINSQKLHPAQRNPLQTANRAGCSPRKRWGFRHFSIHSGHMNTFASTPLPSELVSLLGSSLLGSGIRLISFFMAAHHREHLMRLCRTRALEHTVVSARKASGLQLTRRFIAFIAVFFVIAWPKLIAVFYPNVPISVGYSQRSGGFLSLGATERAHHHAARYASALRHRRALLRKRACGFETLKDFYD